MSTRVRYKIYNIGNLCKFNLSCDFRQTACAIRATNVGALPLQNVTRVRGFVNHIFGLKWGLIRSVYYSKWGARFLINIILHFVQLGNEFCNTRRLPRISACDIGRRFIANVRHDMIKFIPCLNSSENLSSHFEKLTWNHNLQVYTSCVYLQKLGVRLRTRKSTQGKFN